MYHARFRFYAELGDFLPADRRQVSFDHEFAGRPSIKDAVEALGVPHPEVDLVVVNGRSVAWDYRLRDGDEVAVYPVFEAIEIAPAVRLRPAPLRDSRFVLDVHLGRLARLLRALGFDVRYDRDAHGAALVDVARAEGRILLTRSRELLKDGRVTHGYWIRAEDPRRQIEEVVDRLELRSQFAPFTRCIACNGTIVARPEQDVADRVPPRARKRATTFSQCTECGKIYWDGTHVERMRRWIVDLNGR